LNSLTESYVINWMRGRECSFSVRHYAFVWEVWVSSLGRRTHYIGRVSPRSFQANAFKQIMTASYHILTFQALMRLATGSAPEFNTGRGQEFLYHYFQTVYGAHLALHPIRTRGSSYWCNAVRAWS